VAFTADLTSERILEIGQMSRVHESYGLTFYGPPCNNHSPISDNVNLILVRDMQIAMTDINAMQRERPRIQYPMNRVQHQTGTQQMQHIYTTTSQTESNTHARPVPHQCHSAQGKG